MHFVIFFPGSHPSSPELLKKHGMADLVAGYSAMNAASGPNKVPGLLYHWVPRPHYDADSTEWIDCGAYFVGVHTEQKPTPSELQRARLFDGYAVRLCDGHEWIVPAAVRLPRDMRLEGGKWTRRVKREFDDFWTKSERYFKQFVESVSNEEGVFSVDEDITQEQYDSEVMGYLIKALRLNYRITPELVSHLGLFDTKTIVDAAIATVTGHEINQVLEALQKKSQSATPDGN